MARAGHLQLEGKTVGWLSNCFRRLLFPPNLGPNTVPGSHSSSQENLRPRRAPGHLLAPLQPGRKAGSECVREAQATAAVGSRSRKVPLRPRYPEPDPVRRVVLEAAEEGGTERARVAGKGGGRRREEGRGRGGASVCHSLSPSVYRGCAEWCAWRRRRLRSSIRQRLEA